MNTKFKILLALNLLTGSFVIARDKTNTDKVLNDSAVQEQTQVPNKDLNNSNKQVQEQVPEKEELELLDQIESEVFYCGSENIESNIITRHDIFKRGFDGGTYTLNDLEDEALADQFSKVLKANITNEDINRNLKKNGLDEKEILNIANNWGFDGKDDFFEYLKKIYRASSATSFEIESQLVATHDEIADYYAQNISEYLIEKNYVVQTAFVPFNNEDKDKLKEELTLYIENKVNKPEYVFWADPFDVKESEITSNNEFLRTLNLGQIYLKEFSDGYSLYKIKSINEARSIPLCDVREQIVLKLKKVKYASVISKVKDKFRCNAVIVRPPAQFPVPTEIEDSN